MRSIVAAGLTALLLVCAACSGGPPENVQGAAPEAPAAPPSAAPGPDEGGAQAAVEEVRVGDGTDAARPGTGTEVATFGAGCFWCTEAVLEQQEGVLDVTSGYMGGTVDDPSYHDVCSGTTGHAEVVQVTFDPGVIPYSELLGWFWRLHDPTTLNRQGADVGTQYRSAIFVHSPAQRAAAEASKTAAQKDFADPIVTEITDASTFWPAEDYHQDYYRLNTSQGYCRAVIAPKLKKLGLE